VYLNPTPSSSHKETPSKPSAALSSLSSPPGLCPVLYVWDEGLARGGRVKAGDEPECGDDGTLPEFDVRVEELSSPMRGAFVADSSEWFADGEDEMKVENKDGE